MDFSSEQVSGDPIKSSLSESQNLMLKAPNLVTGDMERCDVASSDYRQTEATHLANITRNKSQGFKARAFCVDALIRKGPAEVRERIKSISALLSCQYLP